MEETESIDFAVGCLDGSEGILTEIGKKPWLFQRFYFWMNANFACGRK